MESARGRVDHAVALVHNVMREPGFFPQPGELFGKSIKLHPHQLDGISDAALTQYAVGQFKAQRLWTRWGDVRVTTRRIVGTTDMWIYFECRWR